MVKEIYGLNQLTYPEGGTTYPSTGNGSGNPIITDNFGNPTTTYDPNGTTTFH